MIIIGKKQSLEEGQLNLNTAKEIIKSRFINGNNIVRIYSHASSQTGFTRDCYFPFKLFIKKLNISNEFYEKLSYIINNGILNNDNDVKMALEYIHNNHNDEELGNSLDNSPIKENIDVVVFTVALIEAKKKYRSSIFGLTNPNIMDLDSISDYYRNVTAIMSFNIEELRSIIEDTKNILKENNIIIESLEITEEKYNDEFSEEDFINIIECIRLDNITGNNPDKFVFKFNVNTASSSNTFVVNNEYYHYSNFYTVEDDSLNEYKFIKLLSEFSYKPYYYTREKIDNLINTIKEFYDNVKFSEKFAGIMSKFIKEVLKKWELFSLTYFTYAISKLNAEYKERVILLSE